MHEGEAVLPAEIHELDLTHARVEVHTCTLGVGTFAGQVQVSDEVLWKLPRCVRESPAPDGASGQLQQRGRGVGQIAHEPHYQRIPAQAELLQVDQTEDLPREVGQEVVVKAE